MTIGYVIHRRCDEPMKRSKERCRKPNGERWECTGDCKNCICCIYMTQYFREHHVNFLKKEPNEVYAYER